MTQKAKPSIWVKKISQDFLECVNAMENQSKHVANQLQFVFIYFWINV